MNENKSEVICEKTIILTTHNMDEAERMSGRIAIMDRGKLLVVDSPDKLKNNVGEGKVLEIRVSGAGGENIERARKILSQKVHKVKFSEGLFSITDKNVLDNMTSITSILSSNEMPIEDVRLRKKTLEDVFISLTGRGLRE